MDTGAFMDRLENELLRNFTGSGLVLRLTDISGTMA
jgi:hypothetical protein